MQKSLSARAASRTNLNEREAQAVAKPIAEKGRVKNGELPVGMAVMASHVGPYEKLAETHAALRA